MESTNRYDENYESQYEVHWEKLQQELANENLEEFRTEFMDMHPYDQAMFFMEQEKNIRLQIYSYLSPDEIAEIMESIELEDTTSYITEMDPRFASMVLEKMAADNAVDILNELEKDQVASFLTIMDKDAADEIKQLLHYEEKTAGSIMTTEFVAIFKTNTARQAMQHLKEEAPDAETIYYLYVLDDEKRLVGVLSLRDLIIADEETRIEEIMSEKIVAVSVGKDQEDVAQMIRDYDFLALPVVDFQEHLLGIITVDDILDVMDEEASDDYSKLAGVSEIDRPDDSAFLSAKKRLPWLIILSFLGMLTASLIGRFEDTLDQVAVLAIFIPLIAGMAGNTGTQALAVAVRGLATGDYGKQGKIKLIIREAGTGVITGTVCGIVITGIVYLWKGDIYLGLLVGFSITASLVVATIAGSLVPVLMDKMNIDPAVASGPFITTINDIISVLIYFGMATAFMGFLV
ncbi:magnesium transporter [Virgibacillus halodenitrificans]|uniref:Magnesium transporter MgtE n=1 Tax=Virgibacillus halodenitrificans TaxID=1482 RepID=A0AAC9NJK3_VIRHA|nr:magnesium transporter [Virgibacillus halodenitrificans]APC47527.1 magnesium transporter [Virgibacillus halodenitrificans]MBD1221812.1 magnesium transporter [Virgibacillus halodenitrificans]MCG1028607.1 magnesium transporter [Virgibacillus halodenitrificans]MCJ0931982.1 magnesium transporter [Virgibacillus halodenitrificans]MEC2158663.1 magnesium transporter [Virgibacillus halodenitrificans]